MKFLTRCALYTLLAILAESVICMFFSNLHENSRALNLFCQKVQAADMQESDRPIVYLYFADKENSFLIAEERVLFHSADPVEFGKIIIKALIDGPQKGLMRTIPVGTMLRAFYITQDGTAYADITKTIKERHPGGTKTEIITIYSIVNSLILNISEINAVKILIEGCESTTLTGHIDLNLPLKANMLLIR